MATIKVKRSPESKGRCKLAWNKVYNAEVNPSYKDSYIIGNNVYLSKWFTPVSDQQPKQKPVVKTDPETGKLKVERDWSKPLAFPEWYEVPENTRVIKIAENDYYVKKGSVGLTKEKSFIPYVKWENEDYDLAGNKKDHAQVSDKLAPLNPTDHPEHPDFGKVNRVVHTKNAEVTTIDTTGTEQAPEPYKELPIPKPKHDIRDTIAEYVRKYGHELTAIELIGHLTIDKQ